MSLELHNLQTILDVDLDLVTRAVRLGAGLDDPEISVSIVDDPEIRKINRDHLGRDHPTDVIAFDYREDEGSADVSGEIIISAETARRVAAERGHEPEAELVFYVIHGTLHLMGFDDQDPEEARKMWRHQEGFMKKLGLKGDFAR